MIQVLLLRKQRDTRDWNHKSGKTSSSSPSLSQLAAFLWVAVALPSHSLQFHSQPISSSVRNNVVVTKPVMWLRKLPSARLSHTYVNVVRRRDVIQVLNSRSAWWFSWLRRTKSRFLNEVYHSRTSVYSTTTSYVGHQFLLYYISFTVSWAALQINIILFW